MDAERVSGFGEASVRPAQDSRDESLFELAHRVFEVDPSLDHLLNEFFEPVGNHLSVLKGLRRRAQSTLRLRPSSFQFAARQTSKRFQIFFTRFHGDVVRQRRHRWLFFPADSLEIVADVLLVEAWLWSAGRIAAARPEARRVWRERFIDEHDAILRLARSGNETELEFRVGNDDSDGFGVRRSLGIEL